MDAREALVEICSAAARVADKWFQIKESNGDAEWDDFSFYKGNARWAAGARHDLVGLSASSFASAEDVCDAAAALVRNRGWDGDYEEPRAARDELLAAIEEVRAKMATRAVEERAEAPRAQSVAVPAAPNPDAARGAPYRSAPRPGPARYDGRRPVGFVLKALVVAAVLVTLLVGSLPEQMLLAGLWGLVFASAAALAYWLRIHTVIHEERVEQGRARWMRAIRLDDVRYVIDDGVDAMATATRFSSDLGSVVLTGADGTAVRLTSDIPRDVREDTIAAAVAAAVRAAQAEIAGGGSYRGPSGLVRLDAETLHGFRVGLTVSRAWLPVSEIAEIKPGGQVVGRDGASLCIGEGDRVLVALLRERGLGT